MEASRRRNHTPITTRRLDGEEIVVSGPAFDRLNERCERARSAEAAKTRSQLEAKRALFVLQPGDLITVDATGDDQWWYVMR